MTLSKEEELTASTIESLGVHGISEDDAQQTLRDVVLLKAKFSVIASDKTVHSVLAVCLSTAWDAAVRICDGDEEASKDWILRILAGDKENVKDWILRICDEL